jgi:hypothetical protein
MQQHPLKKKREPQMTIHKLKILKPYPKRRSSYGIWRAAVMGIMNREHAMKIERLRKLVIQETGIPIRRDYFWHNLVGLPLMIDCQSAMIFSE